MVCDCLVELSHVFIDKTFTYKKKDEDLNKIRIGKRVLVPFGKQTLEAFVLNIRKSDEENLKEVIEIIDDYPVLNDELLKLGNYIKENTLCTLMTAYQAMLPLALKAKVKTNLKPKTKKYVRLNNDIDLTKEKFNEQQNRILDLLKDENFKEKTELEKVSKSSVATLLKKNIIVTFEKEIYRYNLEKVEEKTYTLNEEQRYVYERIINNMENITYLIHGVTGSGKTNIYMEVIDKVLKDGKNAILLVPEISLTPQIIKRFTSKFNDIAVLHSGLSDGEKYDEWRKIKENKARIVLGARSAIFAPFDNIGVIIIDEEHSNTYKQENNPRYNAIDIAKERCKYHNCPLILGSATPSLESYARAKKGVYQLLTLEKRYNNSYPNIEIIDMNKEFKKTNSYFSSVLLNELNKVLDNNEQAIIFLNRRGYSSFVTCTSCGYAFKCPNCDISLTYHKTSNMLRCHYCGYATNRPKTCPDCNEELKDFGLGTQKVEEELKKLLTNSKIIRMDIDTTTKKDSHEKIIKDFSEQKYNILIGTQMIAKGLDFPNVTLVGVLNADISLNFPDFRSSENTFQLLNQVAGRSGRGEKQGKVLIQTFNKDHYAIKYAKENDYINFYKEELSIRKKLNYPPYYYLCLIKVISKDYQLASSTSIKIAKFLKQNIQNNIILGPSVSNTFKINNNYHFQIIIKYKNIDTIKGYLHELQDHYFNDKNIKVEIDINPMKL